MDPINYNIDVANPVDTALKGYQTGLAINQVQAQQQQAQAQQLRAQQQQADLSALSQDASPDAIGRVILKYPELSEQLKRGSDVLAPAQLQSRIKQAIPIYAAIQSGSPDVAVNLLNEQAAAARNSNNEPDAKAAETLAQLVKDHPEFAKTTIGLKLASELGPDKFTEAFKSLGEEQRAQAEAPAKLREATAKAGTAEAESTLKSAQAKNADKLAQQDLDKAAADIGLSKAQKEAALANARHLSADTKKTLLETKYLEQSGGVPTDKKFGLESDLRKEYSTQTKHFTDVKEAFARIKSAENTGAGDIALVYSYMKILDPTSVVREGEFATAQNSAGIPAAVVASYNKALNGERLTGDQRKSFVSQSQKLLNAAGVREKEVRKGIDQIAGNYGLNKGNIYFNNADVSNAGSQPVSGQNSNIVVDY